MAYPGGSVPSPTSRWNSGRRRGSLPWSNGVHHDADFGRRPLFHALVADGTLPAGYATDDGAGVLYRGTTMVEALTERDGARAYRVERSSSSGGAVETPLDVRRVR